MDPQCSGSADRKANLSQTFYQLNCCSVDPHFPFRPNFRFSDFQRFDLQNARKGLCVTMAFYALYALLKVNKDGLCSSSSSGF